MISKQLTGLGCYKMSRCQRCRGKQFTIIVSMVRSLDERLSLVSPLPAPGSLERDRSICASVSGGWGFQHAAVRRRMGEPRVQRQQYREEINSDQQIPCYDTTERTYILISSFSRPRKIIETPHGPPEARSDWPECDPSIISH